MGNGDHSCQIDKSGRSQALADGWAELAQGYMWSSHAEASWDVGDAIGSLLNDLGEKIGTKCGAGSPGAHTLRRSRRSAERAKST